VSLSIRILLRSLLNILLVWALSVYLPQYVLVSGGLRAFVTIGALLTLLHLFVQPFLSLATLPLRFFLSFLAFLLVNGAFVWLAVTVASLMKPAIAFAVLGGFVGWMVVILLTGIANWIMRMILR
jgi:uncharacterized membrane protein YvlD (DUF360 family)